MIITCAVCGHPGPHAVVVTEIDGVGYCESCPRCQAELRRLNEERRDTPDDEQSR